MKKRRKMKTVDYLVNMPKTIQFSEDDYIKVRYDVEAMKWIPNRPLRIKYPTARELIREYRKEYKKRRCKNVYGCNRQIYDVSD